MELIADILLVSGASGAAFYCVILSRKLSRLNDLETGVGGAIATLSSQVTEMTKTMARAQKTASESANTLTTLTDRAENVARRLELLVASMHDLPTENKVQTTRIEPDSISRPINKAVTLKKGQETGSLFRSARKEADEVVV